MARNLYVGNLDYSVNEEDISKLFLSADLIVTDVKIIKHIDTLKPRGFSFVEFETEEMATKAIDEFNGRSFMNRSLDVKWAIERAEKKSVRTYESVYTGGKKIYVGNLAYSVLDSQIAEIFGVIGKVVSVKIVTDAQTGKSQGFGFVEMALPEYAKEAIEKLNGKEVNGRKMHVTTAIERMRK